MPHSAPGTSDEKLIEAETEILALLSQSAALRAAGDRSAHPEISDRVFGLDNLVAGMPAQTLAGAAVKLRRLADPEREIECGMAEGDPRSIRHVLDVVVRLLGGEDGKKFRAAEEQVAEAYRVAARDTSSDGAAAAAYGGYLAGVAFVELTEPQSLVAVIIKLRHLLVAGEPLSGYDREQDSVRQCVAFLDRQIGWGASPRGGHD